MLKQKLVSAKNFVVEHQTEILIYTVITLTMAVVLQRSSLKDVNEFLKEHDLYDQYYELNEFDIEC